MHKVFLVSELQLQESIKESHEMNGTKLTTSLVARARISAQETLFRHLGSLSTAALALTTVSKPSPASDISSGCSLSAFGVASKIEASQPYKSKYLFSI